MGGVLLGVPMIFATSANDRPAGWMLVIVGIGVGIAFLIPVNTARKSLDALAVRQYALQKEMDTSVVAGQYLVCPFCETVLELVPHGKQMPEGLRHCLGCGKQVMISQGYTYPLIYR